MDPTSLGLGSERNNLATPYKHMVLEPSAAIILAYCYARNPIAWFIEFRLIPFRSPLLRECSRLLGTFFLFLRLLRCFSSPGIRLTDLCVQSADSRTACGKVSPFGDPRVKGCLPPNRGFSQAATSFIVLLCQGIRHILLM